jgi:PAS domain S-box-containing protein
MRILVVEDDELTVQMLTTVLTQQNYAVEVAVDGEAGWALAESFPFDLVLLDVMIPKLNGLELCRRMRAQGLKLPILLLTGKDSSHDKAIGLDAGADDYLVKPFDAEELVARIRALLRRGEMTTQPTLEWGSLRLDPITCQVVYGETLLSVTPKEYALLELFMRNGRRVFSCGSILEHLWSFEDAPGEEAVRTHIKGLRHKLRAAGASADLVETVYGIGYRLKPLDEKADTKKQKAKPPTAITPKTGTAPTHEQTLAAIAAVWDRLKPRVEEQFRVIEQAIVGLNTQTLGAEQYQQAKREAHSLAGSLGTFGFAEGSRLARQIEQQLQADVLNRVVVEQLQTLMSALRRAVDDKSAGTMDRTVQPDPPAAFSGHAPLTARIMAVDDDPKILGILRILLEPWGLSVTTLEDPRQFWQVLTDTQPDLLILDLQMPHPDGFELCRQMRESNQWGSLPIMVLTAHTDSVTVNQMFAIGADDFVSKPIVGPELVTRIVNRLERVQLQHRLGAVRSEQPRDSTTLCQEDRFFNLALDLLCVTGLDGYFKRVNPAFTSVLGYSEQELLAEPFINFVHPDDREYTRGEIQKLSMGSSVVDFENRYCCKDGSYKWLSWSSVPVLEAGVVYATARDITDHKQQEAAWQKSRDEIELRVAQRTAELVSLNHRLQRELDTAHRLEVERNQAEAELRVSQARFAGILEIADDAIISINTNQHINLFNQGAEKLFGYTAQEVMGKPLGILLPQRSVEAHKKHVTNFGHVSGQARRMGERGTIFGVRKDGSEFPAEASISRLDLGDEIIFTVILRDITERQNISRMKDEFISVVSHELRTPLTSIHGSLGMLASGLLSADSDRGKRLLQIAVDSTDRLVRLINDILDIERIESGRVQMVMQPCNVADLIAAATNEVQSLADKAGIALSSTSISIQVVVDGDRIIQTLTNLLSNAIKFSNRSSTVWLSAELVQGEMGKMGETDQQLKSSPSPLVLFTVKDQGRGIPAEKREAIFERFQQVDASDSRHQDGTGLGLTICRSIVQQHGGSIWVESTVGEGSTFYFTLPIDGRNGGDK